MNRIAIWVYAVRSSLMEQHERILLFDGVCNLCNGLVKFIIRHDTEAKIKFAPLQSKFAADFIRDTYNNVTGPDSVVYISGERNYLRSDAILQLLKDMGSGWKLFYILRFVPRFMRDFLYDLIARSRYRIFGKRESCMIPSADIMQRFIN